MQEMYDWNYVVDRYEDLFANMARLPLPERDRPAIETATQTPTDNFTKPLHHNTCASIAVVSGPLRE